MSTTTTAFIMRPRHKDALRLIKSQRLGFVVLTRVGRLDVRAVVVTDDPYDPNDFTIRCRVVRQLHDAGLLRQKDNRFVSSDGWEVAKYQETFELTEAGKAAAAALADV